MIDEIRKMTEEEEIRAELKNAAMESSPDAMVIVDLQGVIWLVNSATVKFFRYSRQEMLGHEVEMLLPERFRDKHLQYRRDAWRDMRSREMAGRTLVGRTKDGEEFPIDIQLTWLETRHGVYAMAVIRKPRQGEASGTPSTSK